MENFVNFEVFEQAAPLSTVETAIQIVLYEYGECMQKAKTKTRFSNISRDSELVGSKFHSLKERNSELSSEKIAYQSQKLLSKE